ncbi:MAG: response regulator transcription factor [Synergistaceae bacterium]|nr:response regulator transcription factor [Synergistaceae bacterium]
MKRNRIILAEANHLFADFLKMTIERETDSEVIFSAGNGIDAVKNAYKLRPNVLIAGQILPDMNMMQVIREVRREMKYLCFLFIIKETSAELLSLLGEMDRIGVVSESSDAAEFLAALYSVSRGERYISQNVLDDLSKGSPQTEVHSDPLKDITPREREVLYWLSHGLTNQEIASVMILSDKTVKNHVSHILKKLDLADRTKAAALAWKEGLPYIPEEFFSLSCML